jgi:diadenylate cyclase
MNVGTALGQVSWRDFVDVLLVAVVVYHLLKLIRGTRAASMLIGMVFVGALYWLAKLAGLSTLETLLERFLILLPFAILLLFQQEIRRGLANFGSPGLFHRTDLESTQSVIQHILAAASTLAARKVGALIVLERLEGLRDYSESGVILDATVSPDLLVGLFGQGNPLHDGAVIIANGRIAAAGCWMPLSTSQAIGPELGTRHRAALGISEETDAVAVVLSEETGSFSLAVGGRLEHDLAEAALRSELSRLLAGSAIESRAKRGSAT